MTADQYNHADICTTCHPIHLQEMIRIHQLWQESKLELQQQQQQHVDTIQQYTAQIQQNEQNTTQLIQQYQQQIDSLTQQHNTLKQQYNTLQQQYNNTLNNHTQHNTENNKYQALYTDQIQINTQMAIRIRELESVLNTIQTEQSDTPHSTLSTVLLHERVNAVANEATELVHIIQSEKERTERYKSQLLKLQQQYDTLKSEQQNQIITHTSSNKHTSTSYDTDMVPHDIQQYTNHVTSIVPYNSNLTDYIAELNVKWHQHVQQRIKQIHKQYNTQLHELQRKLDYRSSYSSIIEHAKAVRYKTAFEHTRQQHMRCRNSNKDIDALSLATIDALTQQIEQLQNELNTKQNNNESKQLEAYKPNISDVTQSVNRIVESMTDNIWQISNNFCDDIIDKAVIQSDSIDDMCNAYLDRVEECIDKSQQSIKNELLTAQ